MSFLMNHSISVLLLLHFHHKRRMQLFCCTQKRNVWPKAKTKELGQNYSVLVLLAGADFLATPALLFPDFFIFVFPNLLEVVSGIGLPVGLLVWMKAQSGKGPRFCCILEICVGYKIKTVCALFTENFRKNE